MATSRPPGGSSAWTTEPGLARAATGWSRTQDGPGAGEAPGPYEPPRGRGYSAITGAKMIDPAEEPSVLVGKV